jgi:hypothetical protein
MVLPENRRGATLFFEASGLKAFRKAIALDGGMPIAGDIVSQQKYRY